MAIDNFASQNQVPIEPRVPESSSIGHDIALGKVFKLRIGNGGELEARAVRVSADDFEP
jgi:hypothetical protein